MFTFLGKKEIIGTALWIGPMGLSVMGYLQWTPYRAMESLIVGVVVVSAIVGIGGVSRFLINYLRGPRMPLG